MPNSAGGFLGCRFATGTASAVCTTVGSIREHNVSATLDVSDGVVEGVSEGVSDGGALVDTSGGTLGAGKTGEVEKAVDQERHVRCIARDALEKLTAFVIDSGGMLGRQDRRVAVDRPQRRAQVVRDAV